MSFVSLPRRYEYVFKIIKKIFYFSSSSDILKTIQEKGQIAIRLANDHQYEQLLFRDPLRVLIAISCPIPVISGLFP